MPVDRSARGPARVELDALVQRFQALGRPHAILSVNGSNPAADIEITKVPAKQASSADDLLRITSVTLTAKGHERLGE